MLMKPSFSYPLSRTGTSPFLFFPTLLIKQPRLYCFVMLIFIEFFIEIIVDSQLYTFWSENNDTIIIIPVANITSRELKDKSCRQGNNNVRLASGYFVDGKKMSWRQVDRLWMRLLQKSGWKVTKALLIGTTDRDWSERSSGGGTNSFGSWTLLCPASCLLLATLFSKLLPQPQDSR